MNHETQDRYVLMRRLRCALEGVSDATILKLGAVAQRVLLQSREALPDGWLGHYVVMLSSGVLFVEGRRRASGEVLLLRTIHPQQIVLWPQSLEASSSVEKHNISSYKTSECILIPEGVFERELTRDESLRKYLLRQLCDVNRAAISRVRSLALQGVDERIKGFKSLWAREVGLALGHQFRPSNEEIARFIGASVGAVRRVGQPKQRRTVQGLNVQGHGGPSCLPAQALGGGSISGSVVARCGSAVAACPPKPAQSASA